LLPNGVLPDWGDLIGVLPDRDDLMGLLPADLCMAALSFGMVIVDESHNLRSSGREHDNPHTEACAAALNRAQRVVLLSGTPSLSRPFDLFRQVGLLCRSQWNLKGGLLQRITNG
jgi:hypothetical protein